LVFLFFAFLTLVVEDDSSVAVVVDGGTDILEATAGFAAGFVVLSVLAFDSILEAPIFVSAVFVEVWVSVFFCFFVFAEASGAFNTCCLSLDFTGVLLDFLLGSFLLGFVWLWTFIIIMLSWEPGNRHVWRLIFSAVLMGAAVVVVVVVT